MENCISRRHAGPHSHVLCSVPATSHWNQGVERVSEAPHVFPPWSASRLALAAGLLGYPDPQQDRLRNETFLCADESGSGRSGKDHDRMAVAGRRCAGGLVRTIHAERPVEGERPRECAARQSLALQCGSTACPAGTSE